MGKECDHIRRYPFPLLPSSRPSSSGDFEVGRRRANWTSSSLLTWPQPSSFLGWLLPFLRPTVATDTLSMAGIQMLVSHLEDLWGPSPTAFHNIHLFLPRQRGGIYVAPHSAPFPSCKNAKLPLLYLPKSENKLESDTQLEDSMPISPSLGDPSLCLNFWSLPNI